ncbi:hypothetical protein GT370_20110 [Acidocella sp. MX-AZ03]|uniref:nucleotide-binding domain containing protein n=1 Tax=Acidocella sp. MX-AZ03 TaxID=2697363 RepID=UPI0022DE3F53|nr:nucleotide-binding domain containing protein [Acidocella sp. MX-AZ03]WBO61259.1 hypothetical protein GT370_20110 [Acidocella sp. MX-AZ03]
MAPVEGPILFVVGSMSGVSHQQVARLIEDESVLNLPIAPQILREGEGSEGWRAAQAALAAALDAGQDVAVQLGLEEQVNVGEGLLLCHALARLVAPFAARIGGLFSTGGETARAVLVAFGAAGLRLVGEIEPGVPLSVTEGAPAGRTAWR